MNIITLNTWAGMVREPLLSFFERHSADTDIFCLQEVTSDGAGRDLDIITKESGDLLTPDLFQKIQDALPEHVEHFLPLVDDYYGLAFFVRKDISVLDFGEVMIYQSPKFPDPGNSDVDHDRKLFWILLEDDGCQYLVMNVHGHWVKAGKLDTPERIEQSRVIADFMKEFHAEGSTDEERGEELAKILCGDLNLLPDTESMRILEGGMVNLITENGITSTRTTLHEGDEKLSDYVLVSENCQVESFEVLPEEVSNHSALRVVLK